MHRRKRPEGDVTIRFEKLIDHLPDLVAVVDPGGRIHYVSPSVGRVLGYEPSQIEGADLLSMTHPGDLDRARAALQSLDPRAEAVLRLELRLRHRDGSWRLLEAVGQALPPAPKTGGIVLTARDITPGSRSVSETVRLGALGAAANAVVITDLRGVIEYANPAFTALTGYSVTEAIGQTPRMLKSDQHDDAFYEDLWKTILAGRVWHGRLINRRKDGSTYIEDQTITPIRDEAGQITHFVAIKLDVTKRHAAEREVLQSRKRLEREKAFTDQLIASLPGLFYLFDATGRLIRWNARLEEVTGYTTDEITDRSALDFFESDRDRVADYMRQVLDTGAATFEASLKAKAGRELTYVFSGARIQVGGHPCVVGLAINIDDKRRLERQVQAAQRMEAVGRLAGGVAHDFNNMLSVIMSYTQFLLEEIPVGNKQRGDVLAIAEAAERAASLTRQILAFSRRQIQSLEVLDLNDLVAQIERMMRRLIGEDIELVTHLTVPLWPVSADRSQLEQVLLNLVVNARDAMPTGGKLTIETFNRSIDEVVGRNELADLPPDDYVMLSVSDTGVGIDAETRAHIFEPFFTSKRGGTGLGLATVYGIVKQSRGFVWVHSEQGQGTTFKIYLPRADQAESIADRGALSPAKLDGFETVLVVEDEETVRSAAERILESLGYQVLSAANGHDALALCEAGEPSIDLVLTDVVMPEMSGRQLVDQLRELSPTLPAIYMSGYTDNAIVQHGVLEAGTHYVQKPFTPASLAAKVREVLDG